MATPQLPSSALGPEILPGGVLSDLQIRALADDKWLIAEGFEEDSLQPASYDVTIADDGLIDPNGKEVPPRKSRLCPRSVVLGSGDTALFSTRELFRMPHHVAGNVSIKNRLASEGLTLLSGLLIDPGYGLDEQADDTAGCRLFLHVANIGADPIVLRPGKDQIARVQFLPTLPTLDGYPDRREKVRASRWREQRRASLGFLTELKDLKREVEVSDNRSQQVVLFGFVVLAVALIGASFSTILSIATNQDLSQHLHEVFPSSSNQTLIWAIVFLGVAIWALAIVLAFGRIGQALKPRWRRYQRTRG